MQTLRKIIKMISIVVGSIFISLLFIGFLFIQFSPQFGHQPDNIHKEAYRAALNYHKGKFTNEIPTTMEMDFSTLKSLIRDQIRGNPNGRPSKALPIVQVDQQQINNIVEAPALIWFGHSAFFLKIEGLNILIDPMFGNSPSPMPLLGGKRFSSTLPIEAEALPFIDVVVISHDHYDHLDYGSIKKIKNKVGRFYVPLGVGAHLKAWGVPQDKIHEMNWGDSIKYKEVTFICTPARHFSGRGLWNRNTTLWCSWVINSPQKNLFFSGDSGYGPHFKAIGEQYGPFDFAMMECGQYDKRWENIHMLPEQTVKAAQDIQTKLMMPIHWGAFRLAFHDWDNPVKRATLAAKKEGMPLITPKIGETIILNDQPVRSENWWEDY